MRRENRGRTCQQWRWLPWAGLGLGRLCAPGHEDMSERPARGQKTRLIGLRHLNHPGASVILPTKQEGMRVYNMPHLAQLRRPAGLFGEYYCLTGLCAACRAKSFLSRQIQQGQLVMLARWFPSGLFHSGFQNSHRHFALYCRPPIRLSKLTYTSLKRVDAALALKPQVSLKRFQKKRIPFGNDLIHFSLAVQDKFCCFCSIAYFTSL